MLFFSIFHTKIRIMSQKKSQTNSLTIDITVDLILHAFLLQPLSGSKKDSISEALVLHICCMQLLFYLALMFHTTFRSKESALTT